MAQTHPTTIEGAAALLRYVYEFAEREGEGILDDGDTHEMHKHLADALSQIAIRAPRS
jgi:hypothetical protein